MKTKNTPALAALVLFVATLGLSACNTMEGAGQDIKAGGQAIEKSADRNRGY